MSATRNITPEVEDIIHTIKISSTELESSSKSIMSLIQSIPDNDKILHELGYIKFHIERINKLSSLLTKADINSLKEHTKVDIPNYIKEYLPNYSVSIDNIQFNQDFKESFIRKISLLDLSVILDNLISNSKKQEQKRYMWTLKKRMENYLLIFQTMAVELKKLYIEIIHYLKLALPIEMEDLA